MITLIPNFHFDLTWHKDSATFLRISSQIFNEALDLLDADPDYRFTIDHAAFLDGFLSTYPEQAERVRDHVRSGRLSLVGGMVSMMDCDIPEGETFARQLFYGQHWLEKHLGKRAGVGWLIDNYGYAPQLPQLLRQAGMEALEICLWWAPEGFLQQHSGKSEFLWQGLDGSQVMVHTAVPNYTGPVLPGARSYDEPPLFFGPEEERALALRGLEDWVKLASDWSTSNELLGHVGGDFRHPVSNLSSIISWWNELNLDKAIVISTPDNFFLALKERSRKLPVWCGEISPKMRTIVKSTQDFKRLANSRQFIRPPDLGRFGEGYGEAKVERKQLDRAFQAVMRTAEEIAAWAWVEGALPVQEEITSLYFPVLVYGHHDPFIGCCVKEEYDRMLDLFRSSIHQAARLGMEAIKYIAGQTETRGPGQPFVVFNPLSFARTEPVVFRTAIKQGEAVDIQVMDEQGNLVASQPIQKESQRGAGQDQMDILVMASVPACGHQVYFVRPIFKPQTETSPKNNQQPAVIENSRYRLEFSLAGVLTRLIDRRMGMDLVGPNGVELILEEDLGCFCHIDPTGRTWRQSADSSIEVLLLENGPFRQQIIFLGSLVTDREEKRIHFRQTITLSEDVPWIGFHLEMGIPSGEDIRARVCFHLPGKCEQIWAETPFGALQRQEELAHMVHWVDCTGSGWGIGLLNQGLSGYEVQDDKLWLTLWRGLSLKNDCISCLPKNQREPLIERGNREFHYALLPHVDSWREAGLVQAGQAYNHALLVIPAEQHPGKIPARHSWFQVLPQHIILSAVKKGEVEDALVLRLYESSGERTRSKLTIPSGFSAWRETNLLEDQGELIAIGGSELDLIFNPFEIKTLILAK